jgi:thymidine kinase
MFAGKTTEMLRRVQRMAIARRRCVLVQPACDTRAVGVQTHDLRRSDGIDTLRAATLAELGEQLAGYECVGVDEGQFFPDLAAGCADLARAGKIVVVSALDGDFSQRPFTQVAILVPLCDSVVKLCAVCACGADAPFSKRVDGANHALVAIGGPNEYRAQCRACYEE